jgi:hypothetical protein
MLEVSGLIPSTEKRRKIQQIKANQIKEIK